MPALLAIAVVAALCGAAAAGPSSAPLDRAAAAIHAGDIKKARALLAGPKRSTMTSEQREQEALLYAELKDYGVARSLMEARIKESPGEPRLRLYLATIVARAGDRGATLAALAEARRLKPTAQDRQRMAFLHQDLKDYEPARELLDELIAQAPEDLSIRLDRASLAAQSGDRGGALKHLAAARELKPGPEERRRMAALYRGARELGSARGLLDGLIVDSPRDAGLRLELAALETLAGDRLAAIEALDAATQRAADPAVRRRIAASYQDLQAYGQARAMLQGLVRDVPRDATARLELAELEARHGDPAAARAALAAAHTLEPDLQERQRMARIHNDLRDLETARRIIDALIAEQPRDPQLRLTRAEFAAGAGDKASALAFLDETRECSPDPDDRRRMATLYERLGEARAARAIVEEPGEKSR